MSGLIFTVAAPSGAGKSSLVNAVLADDPQLVLSISYTTRRPRAGEVHGREYHFVDGAAFERMRTAGELLESAEVHGNFYGTAKAPIVQARAAGRDILLEIDWQGARQVQRIFPEAIGVFIMPPSIAELERRLRARGKDSAETIRRRLDAAAAEMGHAVEFDYVIINRDFEDARRDLAAIVRASRLALAHQSARYPELIKPH